MAEVNTASNANDNAKKLRHPKRKINVRLDMTSMVDIAILLPVSANRGNMLLSTLSKIHPAAEFSCYVNLLDNISKAELVPQNDREFIAEYIVKNREELGAANFTDTTFSYRYTTAIWVHPKDDRALKLAINNASASEERREP